MNKQFIAYGKLSKKRQREIDRERRGSWGAINPVTKRPERSDAYKRHEEKQNTRRYASYARELWDDDHSDGRFLWAHELDCNEKCHIYTAMSRFSRLADLDPFCNNASPLSFLSSPVIPPVLYDVFYSRERLCAFHSAPANSQFLHLSHDVVHVHIAVC